MEIKLLYPTGSSITIRFRTLAARWKYYHSFHLAAYNHEKFADGR